MILSEMLVDPVCNVCIVYGPCLSSVCALSNIAASFVLILIILQIF